MEATRPQLIPSKIPRNWQAPHANAQLRSRQATVPIVCRRQRDFHTRISQANLRQETRVIHYPLLKQHQCDSLGQHQSSFAVSFARACWFNKTDKRFDDG